MARRRRARSSCCCSVSAVERPGGREAGRTAGRYGPGGRERASEWGGQPRPRTAPVGAGPRVPSSLRPAATAPRGGFRDCNDPTGTRVRDRAAGLVKSFALKFSSAFLARKEKNTPSRPRKSLHPGCCTAVVGFFSFCAWSATLGEVSAPSVGPLGLK
jgi:hypothetical protein